MDFYKILGIDRRLLGGDEEQAALRIKNAYKLLSKAYHPDRSDDPEAPEKFRQVQEAYDTLSDPLKRRAYDAGFAIVKSVYDQFLRDDSGKNVLAVMRMYAPKAPQPGITIQMTASINTELLSTGGVVDIVLPEESAHAGKTVSIEIPSGSRFRNWCTLKEYGTAGKNGAPNGDLRIVFKETN